MRFSFLLFLFFIASFSAIGQNEYVHITKVTVTGNKKTKEKIILRELDINVGDSLPKNKIDTLLVIDTRKIVNRNLFNDVKLSLKMDSTQHNAELLVEVVERWYVFPGIDVSWADRNFNEWWYTYNHDIRRLKYGVYTGIENITGNGDRLGANIILGFQKQYGLKYTRPYIDKKQKTGIEVGFSYNTFTNIQYTAMADRFRAFEQDLKPVRKSLIGNATVTRRTGFYLLQSLTLGYSHHKIVDSVAIKNPNYFLDGLTRQSYLSLTYNLRLDRRDNINYPLNGYLLNFQLSKLGIVPQDNVNMTYGLASIALYKPISKKIFISTSLRGRLSWPWSTIQQPYFQRQTTGFGIRNELVRGYETYIIDGQAFGIMKNNIKYELLNKTFYIKALPTQFRKIPIAVYARFSGDLGYVANRNPELTQSKLSNKPLLGGGFAIDVVTFYNVVLQFSFYGNQMGEYNPVPRTSVDF